MRRFIERSHHQKMQRGWRIEISASQKAKRFHLWIIARKVMKFAVTWQFMKCVSLSFSKYLKWREAETWITFCLKMSKVWENQLLILDKDTSESQNDSQWWIKNPSVKHPPSNLTIYLDHFAIIFRFGFPPDKASHWNPSHEPQKIFTFHQSQQLESSDWGADGIVSHLKICRWKGGVWKLETDKTLSLLENSHYVHQENGMCESMIFSFSPGGICSHSFLQWRTLPPFFGGTKKGWSWIWLSGWICSTGRLCLK